ncbi:hypothetical protein SAMN05660211_01393 [Enterocloster clostridioformis]|nr:hypothetical protein SAMN05660211_01393 [Enterocloster clostridioformis]
MCCCSAQATKVIINE